MTASSLKVKRRPARRGGALLPMVVVTALATAGAIALANYEGERMHHATEIIERPAAAAAAE